MKTKSAELQCLQVVVDSRRICFNLISVAHISLWILMLYGFFACVRKHLNLLS